jgi:hypothetical protein
LANLGHPVSEQTIGKILKRHGIALHAETQPKQDAAIRRSSPRLNSETVLGTSRRTARRKTLPRSTCIDAVASQSRAAITKALFCDQPHSLTVAKLDARWDVGAMARGYGVVCVSSVYSAEADGA